MKQLLFILGIALITLISAHNEQSVGKCIILDGASSAGKSTLARHLVEILPGAWKIMHHSLCVAHVVEQSKQNDLLPDDYVYKGLPDFFKTIRITIAACQGNEKNKKRQEWQHIHYEWRKLFYENVAQELSAGTNIILDASLYSKQELTLAQNALRSYEPYFVFLHIPFETLIERIHKRNLHGDIKEYRYLNQVIHQYACCYCAQEQENEYTIGMLSTDTIQKIIHTYANCLTDSMFPFLPIGNQLIEEVMTILGISEKLNSFITPRLLHDVIVNTQHNSPHQISIFVRNAFFDTANHHNTFVCNTPGQLYENKK